MSELQFCRGSRLVAQPVPTINSFANHLPSAEAAEAFAMQRVTETPVNSEVALTALDWAGALIQSLTCLSAYPSVRTQPVALRLHIHLPTFRHCRFPGAAVYWLVLPRALCFLWLNASSRVGIAPAYSDGIRVERC